MCYTVKPDLFFANFFAVDHRDEVPLKEVFKAQMDIQKKLNAKVGPNGAVFIDLNNRNLFEFAQANKKHIRMTETSIQVIGRETFELVKKVVAKQEYSINWRLPKELKSKYISSFAQYTNAGEDR